MIIDKIYNSSNSNLIGNNYKWLIFSKDHLLITSNKGLTRVSYKNLYFDILKTNFFFNKYSGYSLISAQDPVIDRNGNVFVHTNNKILKIAPEFSASAQRKICFEDANINTKKVKIEDIANKTLPYSINNVSFIFHIINYPTSKNTRYSYRINIGKWIEGNNICQDR